MMDLTGESVPSCGAGGLCERQRSFITDRDGSWKPFERITMMGRGEEIRSVDWNEVENWNRQESITKEHNIEFEETQEGGHTECSSRKFGKSI